MLRSVKEIMWYKAGITRNGTDLGKALGQLEDLYASIPEAQVNSFRDLMNSIELRHLVVSAEMICRAALLRTESRGAHYRSDYPQKDDSHWLGSLRVRKTGSEASFSFQPGDIK